MHYGLAATRRNSPRGSDCSLRLCAWDPETPDGDARESQRRLLSQNGEMNVAMAHDPRVLSRFLVESATHDTTSIGDGTMPSIQKRKYAETTRMIVEFSVPSIRLS